MFLMGEWNTAIPDMDGPWIRGYVDEEGLRCVSLHIFYWIERDHRNYLETKCKNGQRRLAREMNYEPGMRKPAGPIQWMMVPTDTLKH